MGGDQDDEEPTNRRIPVYIKPWDQIAALFCHVEADNYQKLLHKLRKTGQPALYVKGSVSPGFQRTARDTFKVPLYLPRHGRKFRHIRPTRHSKAARNAILAANPKGAEALYLAFEEYCRWTAACERVYHTVDKPDALDGKGMTKPAFVSFCLNCGFVNNELRTFSFAELFDSIVGSSSIMSFEQLRDAILYITFHRNGIFAEPRAKSRSRTAQSMKSSKSVRSASPMPEDPVPVSRSAGTGDDTAHITLFWETFDHHIKPALPAAWHENSRLGGGMDLHTTQNVVSYLISVEEVQNILNKLEPNLLRMFAYYCTPIRKAAGDDPAPDHADTLGPLGDTQEDRAVAKLVQNSELKFRQLLILCTHCGIIPTLATPPTLSRCFVAATSSARRCDSSVHDMSMSKPQMQTNATAAFNDRGLLFHEFVEWLARAAVMIYSSSDKPIAVERIKPKVLRFSPTPNAALTDKKDIAKLWNGRLPRCKADHRASVSFGKESNKKPKKKALNPGTEDPATMDAQASQSSPAIQKAIKQSVERLSRSNVDWEVLAVSRVGGPAYVAEVMRRKELLWRSLEQRKAQRRSLEHAIRDTLPGPPGALTMPAGSPSQYLHQFRKGGVPHAMTEPSALMGSLRSTFTTPLSPYPNEKEVLSPLRQSRRRDLEQFLRGNSRDDHRPTTLERNLLKTRCDTHVMPSSSRTFNRGIRWAEGKPVSRHGHTHGSILDDSPTPVRRPSRGSAGARPSGVERPPRIDAEPLPLDFRDRDSVTEELGSFLPPLTAASGQVHGGGVAEGHPKESPRTVMKSVPRHPQLVQ
eukprot:Rmarinus@m.1159